MKGVTKGRVSGGLFWIQAIFGVEVVKWWVKTWDHCLRNAQDSILGLAFDPEPNGVGEVWSFDVFGAPKFDTDVSEQTQT